ncbi:MAG: hypothetical protein IJW98_01310 [Clostridia bacterium]|nr:hypothetical protein [Clostridia bacterium]
MSLYINSPGYFTRAYGIDEDVYKLCAAISKQIDIPRYTDSLDTIGITPIIAPQSLTDDGMWKEERRVSTASRMASISLRMDYEAYLNGNASQRQAMMLEHILRALQIVKTRLKDRFDYKSLEQDILQVSKHFL